MLNMLDNGLSTNFDSQLNTKTPSAYVSCGEQSIISQDERQRRQKAWDSAKANAALEDIHPTDDMKRISQMYINGEITFEQKAAMMKASILSGQV